MPSARLAEAHARTLGGATGVAERLAAALERARASNIPGRSLDELKAARLARLLAWPD